MHIDHCTCSPVLYLVAAQLLLSCRTERSEARVPTYYSECTFPVFFNGFNVFNFFWSSALKLAVNISNDVQNRPQWVKNSEKLYGLSNVNNNIKMLLFLDGTGR